MIQKYNKHLSRIYRIVILLLFSVTYIIIFDSKIDLGGDNASYYILGQSIADGNGYKNVHHITNEAHYHYPPGYPTIIAGVLRIFKDSVIAIKILNGLLFLASLLIFYTITSKLSNSKHIGIVVSIIVLCNYHLLNFSTIMMSEIPFLFLSLLCFWIILKIDFSKSSLKNSQFLLLIVIVAFSIYMRSVGLVLFLSILVYLLTMKRIRYALVFSIGTLLLYTPWLIRAQSSKGNSYLQQLVLKNPYQPEQGSLNFASLINRIFTNIERYISIEIPNCLFIPEHIDYKTLSISFSNWVLGILIIIFIVIGIKKLEKHKVLFLCYLTLFFGLITIWPEIWYGTRFILPIVPFLVFFLINGVVEIASWVSDTINLKNFKLKLIFVIVLLGFWGYSYAKSSVLNLHEKADAPYFKNYQNYFQLAEWLRDNSKKDANICVRKESLFYLRANRFVTTFKKTIDLEDQIEYLKEKKVDYVVLDQLGFSSTYRYLYPTVQRYPMKFKTIKELPDPKTYLMEFKPELGYWGEWKNNKRNGYGTYQWEDGQFFEGHWKDDVRHGKGKVIFKNGEQLVGNWINGKLQGEAVKLSESGNLIERSIYRDNEKIEVLNTF